MHVEYAWGTYWRKAGKPQEAQRHFEAVLAQQPRHELARLALAELLEAQLQPDAALAQYLELRASSPASELAAVGLAGMARHRGRLGEARQALESYSHQPEPSAAVKTELGQIALETGEYVQAQQWLEHLPDDPATIRKAITAAAIAQSLTGQTLDADRLFARIRAENYRQTRRYDLEVRVTTDPHDAQARRELQQLTQSPLAPSPHEMDGAEPQLAGRLEDLTSPARRLYAQHCSACHGTNGDGGGRAARHLCPRPTNFRSGEFRLVSASNRVASRDGILAVLQRGIPGTSMRAFDKLTDDERESLAQEVLRLRNAGTRERIEAQFAMEGEALAPEDLDQLVATAGLPGEPIVAREIAAADAMAIARGKEVFVRQACNSCHGDDGIGARSPPLWDDEGRATRGRDLVYEPYKGGSDAASVYLRIALGMPGTPHPAMAVSDQRQITDLVHFCRSLAQEPPRGGVPEISRWLSAAKPPVVIPDASHAPRRGVRD